MRTIILVISVFISQPIFAQLSPVLFDADDRPIGNVVGVSSFTFYDVVDMVSLKGYRAKMMYKINDLSPPEGIDFPGFFAYRFFATNDCTDDPIMLPRAITGNPSLLKPDFSNAIDFLAHGDLNRSGVDEYYPGDMLEFDQASYYVPLDAVVSEVVIKAFKSTANSSCEVMDPCSSDSWQMFDRLLLFNPSFTSCPNIDVIVAGNPAFSNPGFVGYGVPLSIIQANDPAVTGFQSIKYRPPNRIKYVDINMILTDGFESTPQTAHGEAQQVSSQNSVEVKTKTSFDRANRQPQTLSPRSEWTTEGFH